MKTKNINVIALSFDNSHGFLLGLRVKFICFQFIHRSVSQLCEMFGILPCPPSLVKISTVFLKVALYTSDILHSELNFIKDATQLRVNSALAWQARVRITARHPMEVSPTEPSG
jgi:hypothetical protein